MLASETRITQAFEEWLIAQGFSENPFALDGWTAVSLEALLTQRLKYCSQGRIVELKDLGAAEVREILVPHLIAAARGNPQRLLQLGDALLRQVAAQGRALITASDLAEILASFEAQPSSPESAPLDVPSCEGLVLEPESGHVWVDGQLVFPPLTSQEFALLRILYTQAPEIVAAETLIRALWPEECGVVGDEQNLRKLISRLRRRLEPSGAAGKNWRFIHSVRGRGYWLRCHGGTPP